MVSLVGGVGHVWGTLQELLHPRGRDGRFINKNKMAPDIAEALDKQLTAFRPRTFPSDQAASQWLSNVAKPGRFGGGSHADIARFKADFEAVQQDLRDGVINNPSTRKYIQMMDNASIPLPDDAILSRTVSPAAFGLTAQNIDDPNHGIWGQVGNLVADRGYSSTNLGHPIPGPPGSITIVHAVPKGTKVIIPSNSPNDREVVLDRNQQMRISKVQPDGRGGYVVYAAITPNTGQQTPLPKGGHVGVGATGNREARVQALATSLGERQKAVGDTKRAAEAKLNAEEVARNPQPPGPGEQPLHAAPIQQAPLGEHPNSRQPSPTGPAAPNVPARQEPMVSESVGTNSPPTPTAPSAPAVTPPATAPGPGAPPVPAHQAGAESFRATARHLQAPSGQGPQRKQWNTAYDGITQGKKHPDDVLRELEADIGANKQNLDTRQAELDAKKAKLNPDEPSHEKAIAQANREQAAINIEKQNNDRLQKLADTTKSHFGLEGRQAAPEAKPARAPRAKKAAPAAPAAPKEKAPPTGPVELHNKPVVATPAEQRAKEDAVIRRAQSLPETPRNEEEARIKQQAADIMAKRSGKPAEKVPAPAESAAVTQRKAAKAAKRAAAAEPTPGLKPGGVREQAVAGRKPTPDEIRGMTVAELRNTAKAHNVAGTSGMRKEQLQNHLVGQLHGGGERKAAPEVQATKALRAPGKPAVAPEVKATEALRAPRKALGAKSQTERAKAFAKDNGFVGKPGGWIYDKNNKPVAHGWDSFYTKHQAQIDAHTKAFDRANAPELPSKHIAAPTPGEKAAEAHRTATAIGHFEQLPRNGASEAAITKSVQNFSEKDRTVLLDAARTNNHEALHGELDRIAHENGLTRTTGWPGTNEPFNPSTMDWKGDPNHKPRQGDLVQITDTAGFSGKGHIQRAGAAEPIGPNPEPPKAPGAKGLQDLENQNLLLKDLRNIAQENNIQLPNKVRTKQAIRDYIKEHLGAQPGETKAEHANRLGELKPGELNTPLAHATLTPDRKGDFLKGWNKAAGAAPTGGPGPGRSAFKANNEIRDDLASGKITPAEALRRMENEIGFHQDDLAEAQREIRSGTLQGEELATARQRAGELRQAIANQTKLSKFMRDHFNNEPPVSPKVIKAELPKESVDTLTKASAEDIRKAAIANGLPDPGNHTKDEVLGIVVKSMAAQALGKSKPTPVPEPPHEPNAPHIDEVAKGLDIPELTRNLVQMHLNNPKMSMPAIGRRVRESANGPGSPAYKKAVAESIMPQDKRTPAWRADMEKLGKQQHDMLQLADRLEKMKRSRVTPSAAPAPTELKPAEVKRAAKIAEQTGIPEAQIRSGLEKTKEANAPASDQAKGIVDMLKVAKSRDEASGILKGKTARDLRDIAKAGDVPHGARDTKPVLEQRITQHLVGRRLDSQAIANVNLRPEQPAAASSLADIRKMLDVGGKRLAELPTREEALKQMETVRNREDLLQLAGEHSIPGAKSMSMKRLREELVNSTVSARRNSIATRGFEGEMPKTPIANVLATGKSGFEEPAAALDLRKMSREDATKLLEGKTLKQLDQIAAEHNLPKVGRNKAERIQAIVEGTAGSTADQAAIKEMIKGQMSTERIARSGEKLAGGAPNLQALAKGTPLAERNPELAKELSSKPLPKFPRITFNNGNNGGAEGLTQRLGRTNGDEPLRPPNGGSDQGSLHMDSHIGELWQSMAADPRASNSEVNKVGAIGTDLGRGQITVPEARDRLVALEDAAKDPMVKKRIAEAGDALTAPNDKPSLPSNVPTELKNWLDTMSQIPDMRTTGAHTRIHDQPGDPSRYDRALAMVKDAAAGKPIDGEELHRLGQVHESIDGGYTMQRATNNLFVGMPVSLRRFFRGQGGAGQSTPGEPKVVKTAEEAPMASHETVMRRLGNMTIPELRQEAKRRGIPNAEGMGRNDLVDALAERLIK